MTQSAINRNYSEKQITINALLESQYSSYRAIFQSYNTKNHKNDFSTNRLELCEKTKSSISAIFHQYIKIFNEQKNFQQIKNETSVNTLKSYNIQLKAILKKSKSLKKPNVLDVKRTTHK